MSDFQLDELLQANGTSLEKVKSTALYRPFNEIIEKVAADKRPVIAKIREHAAGLQPHFLAKNDTPDTSSKDSEVDTLAPDSESGSTALDDFVVVMKPSKATKSRKQSFDECTSQSQFQPINGTQMRCLELDPIRIECTG